jgi:hypothetical protein
LLGGAQRPDDGRGHHYKQTNNNQSPWIHLVFLLKMNRLRNDCVMNVSIQVMVCPPFMVDFGPAAPGWVMGEITWLTDPANVPD